MALLDELQALTDAHYTDKTAQDIFFKANILLYMMLGGETGRSIIGGGKTIAVPLEYGKQAGGSFDENTKFSTQKTKVLTMAHFSWAAEYATIAYDLKDKRENNGDAAMIKIIDTKLRNGGKTIRDNMATAIFATGATLGKDITGLGDLFNQTSSTAYGQIVEDDMALWVAGADATSENISFKVMQKIRRLAAVDDNREGKPNLYIATEALRDGYEAALQANQRYSSSKLVEAGFDNILFGGAPVVADSKQASGVVDALNLEYLDIETHKDYNFTKPVWANEVDDPETQVAFIKWSGNLICKNRAAHARHTGLTVA